MRNLFSIAILSLLATACSAPPQEEFSYENMMQQIQSEADNLNEKIHADVAEDAEEQYYIARRGSDYVQICVQAGMVAAAYLNAKNEFKYREWKDRERLNCKTSERIIMQQMGGM
ncbi:hypothetical protein [Sphingomonas sp. MM-1]|uniref:hypothetical protein n=1 Tax=Sphingomonas sp. MM-1 TaxID=745310 RepID=UPI000A85EE2C|nr:hypothetical protein [Sphingomonas sp. MM-1]